MSCFFVINGNGYTLLSCDGRLTNTVTDTVTGRYITDYTSDDNHNKITIINKYLLGMTGSMRVVDIMKNTVIQLTNNNSTYEEIIQAIEEAFTINRKHFNGNGETSTILIVLSGVNNKIPMFTFYKADGNIYTDEKNKTEEGTIYHKEVHNEPDFVTAIRNHENGELFDHFIGLMENGSEINDAIFNTFKEANRLDNKIGGLVRIFFANENMASYVVGKNITPETTITKHANAVFRHAEITGGAVRLGNTTITESMLNAKGAYLDETSIYDGRIRGGQLEANSITANKIQAGAITADKISVNNLQAISADLGTINAGTINGVNINGGRVRAGKYYNLDGSAFMEMGNSTYADFTLNSGSGNQVFQIYDDDGGSIGLRAYGSRFLTTRGDSSSPKGTWNFSEATVENLTVRAQDVELLSGTDLQTLFADGYNGNVTFKDGSGNNKTMVFNKGLVTDVY